MSAHCNCPECRELSDDGELPHGLPDFKVDDLIADDEAVDVLTRATADDRWTLHTAPTVFVLRLPVWGDA
jgi:hypothetical protein